MPFTVGEERRIEGIERSVSGAPYWRITASWSSRDALHVAARRTSRRVLALRVLDVRTLNDVRLEVAGWHLVGVEYAGQQLLARGDRREALRSR
jgi:hypothetical protein